MYKLGSNQRPTKLSKYIYYLFAFKHLHQIIILGFTIGFAQWLVLRKRTRANLWIIATVLAWSIAWPVSFVTLFVSSAFAPALPVALAIGGAVIGMFNGLAQWLILHKQVPGAGRWILQSILAGAAGYGVGGMGIFLPISVTEFRDVIASLGMAAYGMLYGFVTGAVLVRLLPPRVTRQD